MMKQHGQQSGNTQGVRDNSFVFPKNWYFYREGKVQGPAAIDEIMRAGSKDGQGQKILVSKIGFEKWYPIDDLGELFAAQSQMELETAIEIEQLKKMAQQKTQHLRDKQPTVAARNIETLQQQSGQYFQQYYSIQSPTQPKHLNFQAPAPQAVEPPETNVSIPFQQEQGNKKPIQEPVTKATPEQVIAEAPTFMAAAPQARTATLTKPAPTKLSRLQKQNVKRAAKNATHTQTKSIKPTRHGTATMQAAVASAATLEQNVFNQIYVSNKGPLRLGRFQNALGTAFLMFPLSLGLFWISWFRSTLIEVYWHVTGDYNLKGKIPSTWLALIPGVHFYFAYKFARLLRNAEQQDGYRSTQPWFATWLAVFPPFYMMYMQDQINSHWRNHVLVCWQRQKAQAS